MTKEKLSELVSLALAKHEENLEKCDAVRRKEQAAAYAVLGDKAQPYVEDLLTQIERGAKIGQVEYSVFGLPQTDFYLDLENSQPDPRAVVKHPTVTSKVLETLTSYDLKGETDFNNKNKECFIRVKL